MHGRIGRKMNSSEPLTPSSVELQDSLNVADIPVPTLLWDTNGRLVEANQQARLILQLPNADGINATIHLIEDATLHEPGTTQPGNLRIILPDREIGVTAYCHPLKGKKNEIVGFVACLSEDLDGTYKHRVEELSQDIGGVLHSYSSVLVMVDTSANLILESRIHDLEQEAPDLKYDTLFELMSREEAAAIFALTRFADWVNGPGRRENMPEKDLERFLELTKLLKTYKEIVPPESQAVAVREICNQILEVCRDLRKAKVPRELHRNVRNRILQMLVFNDLIVLNQMKEMTAEMGHQVRALREFIISGVRFRERKSVFKVSNLVSNAIVNVRSFAETRQVEFQVKHEQPDLLVCAVTRDVVRALANILHNAIKYSWHQPKTPVFVSIKVEQIESNVHIKVENYGIPIPRDELEQGLIFNLGYRGRLSFHGGRTGTGVGLADARRVAREYGGDLVVTSRPAVADMAEDNYSQPFITVADFIMPTVTGG